jgi:hypothetical protein
MTLLRTWQAGVQLMNSLSHRRLLLSMTGAPTEADWTSRRWLALASIDHHEQSGTGVAGGLML